MWANWIAHILLIVSSHGENPTIAAIREWLRNDRRLGLQHYACSISAIADAPAGDAAAALRDSGGGRSAAAQDGAWEFGGSAIEPPIRETRSAPESIPLISSFVDHRHFPPVNAAELSADAARDALAKLDRELVKSCRSCRLCEKRRQTVFGVGNPRAELMFVGEGPGADEDAQGEPFVGLAGQLLTRMIAAMTLTRDQVYIANVVKCRPPGNRTPEGDEVASCLPILLRQIAIIRPRLIVALGRPASQTLLVTSEAISRLRGKLFEWPPAALAQPELPRISLIPTFHPAYLLRSPDEKSKAWVDLQEAMRFLDIPIPQRGGGG